MLAEEELNKIIAFPISSLDIKTKTATTNRIINENFKALELKSWKWKL